MDERVVLVEGCLWEEHGVGEVGVWCCGRLGGGEEREKGGRDGGGEEDFVEGWWWGDGGGTGDWHCLGWGERVVVVN